MITHDTRRSLSHGNNPVPSPWLATRFGELRARHERKPSLQERFDRAGLPG